MTKPTLHVGTIGGTRAGKTVLCAALSAVHRNVPNTQARVVPLEEWCSGSDRIDALNAISRQNNYHPFETEKRRYVLHDLPGKREFFRRFQRAVGVLDVAIIVVSAKDGIVSETVEQVYAAKNAGVSQFIVFLSQCEMVSSTETLDLAEEELRDALLLAGLSANELPILRGAALPALLDTNSPWEASILELGEALDTHANERPWNAEESFFFVQERPHSIRGRGTVVVGRVERGKIAVGQEVTFHTQRYTYPATRPYAGYSWQPPTYEYSLRSTVVTSIQECKQPRPSASAGDYVGLLLRGVLQEEVRRTRVLKAKEQLVLTATATANVRLYRAEEHGRFTPMPIGHMAYLYFRSGGSTAQINPPLAVLQGASSGCELRFLAPTYVEPGWTFAICDGSEGLSLRMKERMNRRKFVRQWRGIIGEGTILTTTPYVPPVRSP